MLAGAVRRGSDAVGGPSAPVLFLGFDRLAEAANRVYERREVVFDGGADDGVVGVEVAVCQVVSHASDVLPWDGRLTGEQLGVEILDRLADLDEPHSDRIEDQAIGEGAALQV